MNLFGQNLTENDFNNIAEQILNKMTLIVKNKIFRICEIEMYLRTSTHPDLYVHSNKDQQNFGKFYFHKYANGTYKSGTWKGIDIVLGNSDKYFGILIRSIMEIETNTFIEGPCRCVNKILEQFGFDNCADFFNSRINNLEQISLDDPELKLVLANNLEQKDIYVGTRIGLSDKYSEYQLKLYRFVIYENKIKKEKKTLVKMK